MFSVAAHFFFRLGQSSLPSLRLFLQALKDRALVIQDMFLAVPLLGQLFLLPRHRLLRAVNDIASFVKYVCERYLCVGQVIDNGDQAGGVEGG